MGDYQSHYAYLIASLYAMGAPLFACRALYKGDSSKSNALVTSKLQTKNSVWICIQ